MAAHPLQMVILLACSVQLASLSINPASAFSVSELFQRPRLFQRSQQPQIVASNAPATQSSGKSGSNNLMVAAQSKLASQKALPIANNNNDQQQQQQQQINMMPSGQLGAGLPQPSSFGRPQGTPEDFVRFASTRNHQVASSAFQQQQQQQQSRPQMQIMSTSFQPNQFQFVPSGPPQIGVGMPASLAVSARPIMVQAASNEPSVSQSEIVDKIEQHIGQKVEQSLNGQNDPHAFLMSAAAFHQPPSHHQHANQHQQHHQQSAALPNGGLVAASGHAPESSESSEYESSEPDEPSAAGGGGEQEHQQQANPAEKRHGEHHEEPTSNSHHEEEHHHEHPPEAFEIHHKKGGKSFQYFHQGHHQ